MPKQHKRLYQVGPFWLMPPDEKYWDYGICWYVKATRQRPRLGTKRTDFEEAKNALDEHALTHGDGAHKDELVLQTVQRYYLAYGINLPTASSVKTSLGLVRKHWPGTMVSQLKSDVQLKFVTALRNEGLADDTILRYLSNIWAATSYAVQFQHLSEKVVPAALSRRHWGVRTQKRKRRSGQPSKRPLSVEEWGMAFDAAADRGEAFVRYLINQIGTHARPTAIIELKGEQIDLVHRVVDLNPPGREQNKKVRPVVPMCPTYQKWIEEWAVPPHERVVARATGRRKGRPLTMRMLRYMVAASKLPNCTPYTFRHAVASWLAAQGVDKWERKSFMGHAQIDGGNTDRYTHYDPRYLRNAAAAIERLFEAIAPHTRVNLLLREYEDQGDPGALWAGVPRWVASADGRDGTRLMEATPVQADLSLPPISLSLAWEHAVTVAGGSSAWQVRCKTTSTFNENQLLNHEVHYRTSGPGTES